MVASEDEVRGAGAGQLAFGFRQGRRDPKSDIVGFVPREQAEERSLPAPFRSPGSRLLHSDAESPANSRKSECATSQSASHLTFERADGWWSLTKSISWLCPPTSAVIRFA